MTTDTPGIQHHEADPNDPEKQKLAKKIALKLVDKYGTAESTVLALLMLEGLMTALLHMPTPLPEQNIQTITGMLDALRDNVLGHVDCALHINGAAKPTVH